MPCRIVKPGDFDIWPNHLSSLFLTIVMRHIPQWPLESFDETVHVLKEIMTEYRFEGGFVDLSMCLHLPLLVSSAVIRSVPFESYPN